MTRIEKNIWILQAFLIFAIGFVVVAILMVLLLQ